MTENSNRGANDAHRDIEYYISRARYERSQATRRFFRRLFGGNSKSWG
ncbi:MAG: hypothetical protein R3D45_06705 [Rhizobiaceae bacterium]